MTMPAGYCMDSNPQPVDLAAQSHVDSLVQVSSARQSHDWNIISVLLVDEFAADPCLQHLNIFELFRRNNKDVAINDDKVRQFAGLQRSLSLLLEADISGIACEQLECLQHGKPFLRCQHLASVQVLSLDRGPKTPPRTDRRDRNISPRCSHNTIVEIGFARVSPTFALRPVVLEPAPNPVNESWVAIDKHVLVV